MDEPSLLALLREALADALGAPMPPLSRATALEDLPAWDSVGYIAFLAELAGRLGVTFTAAQMTGMRTVGDVLDAIGGQP